MAHLKLTGQKAQEEQISSKITQLMGLLEDRKAVWVKCSPEKKKTWIESDKDPIITLAYQMYEYLHNNFFDGVK